MKIGDAAITLLLFATFIGVIIVLDWWNVENIDGRARAVDGDSIVLNGIDMRLMGIDAPELSQICIRDGKP